MSLRTSTRKAVRFSVAILMSLLFLGLLIYLTISASGALQAVAIAGLGAYVALIEPIRSLWKQWRSAVRQEHAFETWSRYAWEPGNDTFKCGKLNIRQVQIVAQCRLNASYSDVVRMSFPRRLQKPRPDPSEWPLLQACLLPKLKSEAQRKGAAFTNGEQLDMVHVRITRDPRRRPESPTMYTFQIAKTKYYKFAAMSNSLDRTIPDLETLGGGNTLRARWDPDRKFGFADVMNLPAPAKIGTASVVVTREDLIVVHLRGSLMYQVPGGLSQTGAAPVHFLGEGMIERDRESDGTFSPVSTVRRALAEELGLAAEQIDSAQIVPTGVIFDTQRWQPVFCYVIFMPILFADLYSSVHAAADSFEKERLAPMCFDVTDSTTRALLSNEHPSMRLASNHAAMALYFALVYRHGDKQVAAELS